MARRREISSAQKNSRMSLEQMQLALPRLKKRIDELQNFQPEALRDSAEATAETKRLGASIDDALVRSFGSDTVEYRRYANAAFFNWPVRMGGGTSLQDIVQHLIRRKQSSIALLSAAAGSLEEQLEEAGATSVPFPSTDRSPEQVGRKIFLVHGHDAGMRETVARFLERCNFDPVILHEQPNQGKTIIEKFEQSADVGYAIILMSPDDDVCQPDRTLVKRARQNVVLELGYFVGRLGRDRVCALKLGDLEIPSDILGLVWIDFDTHGGWKQTVAKELAASGYEVDWNRVMA